MPAVIQQVFVFLLILAVIIGGMWAVRTYVSFLPAKYVGLIILSIVYFGLSWKWSLRSWDRVTYSERLGN
jgi:hypothetical protein